jgi:capsular exopolysaccharide synthesis family protein
MERIRQAVEQALREREESGLGKQLEPIRSRAKNEASVDVQPLAHRVYADEVKSVSVSEEIRHNNRLVASIAGHPLQDRYRMLRTRILQEMQTNKWKVLAVTSPGPGCGKTLTAANLAIAIARDSSGSAVLVDADLRHPSVHHLFGYEPEFGLNDYFSDGVPLSKLLFKPDMQGLSVLPGRLVVHESAEMLGSSKLTSMLRELRSQDPERIIVLDVAPVLSVDDALVLKSSIDCVVMVVAAGETKRDDLLRAIELLDPVPVIGSVLNKATGSAVSQY